MQRTIIAYIKVDEERAWRECNDGTIAYLEREFPILTGKRIFLRDATIADEDAENPRERYLVYLARFAFEHISEADDISPLTYAQWCMQGGC